MFDTLQNVSLQNVHSHVSTLNVNVLLFPMIASSIFPKNQKCQKIEVVAWTQKQNLMRLDATAAISRCQRQCDLKAHLHALKHQKPEQFFTSHCVRDCWTGTTSQICHEFWEAYHFSKMMSWHHHMIFSKICISWYGISPSLLCYGTINNLHIHAIQFMALVYVDYGLPRSYHVEMQILAAQHWEEGQKELPGTVWPAAQEKNYDGRESHWGITMMSKYCHIPRYLTHNPSQNIHTTFAPGLRNTFFSSVPWKPCLRAIPKIEPLRTLGWRCKNNLQH